MSFITTFIESIVTAKQMFPNLLEYKCTIIYNYIGTNSCKTSTVNRNRCGKETVHVSLFIIIIEIRDVTVFTTNQNFQI